MVCARGLGGFIRVVFLLKERSCCEQKVVQGFVVEVCTGGLNNILCSGFANGVSQTRMGSRGRPYDLGSALVQSLSIMLRAREFGFKPSRRESGKEVRFQARAMP